MTKNGRPEAVSPVSRTCAIFGWLIRARACCSASKRAMTCLLSMPGLRIFTATLRRTGSFCSAMKTTPKPGGQPGASISPVPVGSCTRDAEHLAYLLHGKTSEKMELRHFCRGRVFLGENRESLIQVQQLFRLRTRGKLSLGQVNSLAIA